MLNENETRLMMLNGCSRYHLSKTPSLILVLWLFAASAEALARSPAEKSATSEEITAFFKGEKTVLTFVGYSGAEYEDQASMLQQAERILGELDPKSTIVNIGATAEGIGEIYEVAKRKGFVMAGILSAQAKQYNVALSPHVDYVFYVEDAKWGRLLHGTTRLSPTSEAIVENSDIVIGIGGGDIRRSCRKNGGRWRPVATRALPFLRFYFYGGADEPRSLPSSRLPYSWDCFSGSQGRMIAIGNRK